MAAILITLEEAKHELRVTHVEEDDVIQRKCDEAEDVILNYLKFPSSPFAPATPWDHSTVPPLVRAAILYVVVRLWARRGDEVPGQYFPDDHVKGLLMRWRDPAYA